MMVLLTFLIAVVPVLIWFLYKTLRYYRIEQLRDLPRLKPDLVWGHMKVVGEYIARVEKERKGGHEGMFASLIALRNEWKKWRRTARIT